jgi:hypothetical protein
MLEKSANLQLTATPISQVSFPNLNPQEGEGPCQLTLAFANIILFFKRYDVRLKCKCPQEKRYQITKPADVVRLQCKCCSNNQK